MDPAFNPQNDRYICFYNESSEDEDESDLEKDGGGLQNRQNPRGDAPAGKFVARSKHPASAMFLGAIASTGEVSPPIWFPTGFRLDSEAYIEALRETLIPWMRRVVSARGNVPYLWQQDSAPAHRAKKTLDFLKEQNIPFWSPLEWPPNSPDLNPLDYAVWSMVQQGACKDRPPSVAVLKQRVSAYWKRMDPSEIRAVCRRFCVRLRMCVVKKGSFFD